MLKKLIITILLILVAALVANTQYFAHNVRIASQHGDTHVYIDRGRTGIVVATGLDGRVTAGINIFINGGIDRLLISGVGKGVRKSDITSIAATSGTLTERQVNTIMACCVDLGFDATDTKGNALEAGIWADQYQLEHIIVVTSDFHMPRTMIAFRQHFSPDQLTFYPVKTPWLQLNEHGGSGWWHTPERIRLMMIEMVKYLSRASIHGF